ncbi:MAG: flagellar biosynthesis protein FlhB [Planctomycetes bacterium]|nr:flagellar biosynthesis protein FlhB [Planctomycetota bacterium]
MAEDDADKTEPATARRRQEAREEGNVARSTDLTAAVMLLAAVLLLHGMGMRLLEGLRLVTHEMLTPATGYNPTRATDVEHMLGWAGWIALAAVVPIMLALTAVALVVSVSQVGFLFSTQALMPNLARLSPLKGLKGFFDARAGIRLVMSLSKVGLVGLLACWFILQDLPVILMLPSLEVLPLFGLACTLVYALALKLAVTLLVLAILDWAYQRWQRERDLRMTKEEIKEEMRRMEGDPLVKQRRSRVARQLALQRIGQVVPRADVVVTNPTHFAVALRYDADAMKAPRVVAKGADYMALRIRQIAAASGVPLVERKEVARALYAGVEVGHEVPPELYGAVAEILAYVYRLNGSRRPALAGAR